MTKVASPLRQVMDTVCPMHMELDAEGIITHVGPTLRKLRPDVPFDGLRFSDVFKLRRPHAASMQALLSQAGEKLRLRFREAPETQIKGVIAPLPEGGAVINLGFGISIIDAVRDYALVSTDFADTDLAMEMLYLVEAKSAAMDASRTLNQRLQGAMIAAEEQAYTDTLTGLKNRRAMTHVLDRLIASGRGFSVMQIDLDFFKAVNDERGHAAGDHVLQDVARVMVEETRASDTVARIGGDEFVILFDGLTEEEALERTAHRIIDRIERPILFEGKACSISASCGTALSSRYDVPSAAKLLDDADVALYASKRAGRAQHSFFRAHMRQPSEADKAKAKDI